jgi:predicted dehydrogenase
MGRPRALGAAGVSHDRAAVTSPVESSAFGLVRFAGGRSIQLEAAWVLPQSEDGLSVQLFGAKAGALIETGKLVVTRVGDTGIEELRPPIMIGWPEAYVGPFLIQANRFAAAIRDADADLASAEDGVRVMEIIDALYASGKEQRAIELG